VSSASKIKLNSYDDLFGSDEISEQEISLKQLENFKNHPFKVIEDDSFEQLAESIRENGILTPIIVRPGAGGLYEIISGHRRVRACEILGLETIPAKTVEMSDDEAVIAMVDSNIYREKILPSEKAYAYRMKNEALKHQGRKLEKTSASEIAEGDSERQVFRYIRLTYLIPELLDAVDENKLNFMAGVALSYIPEKGQQKIASYCKAENKYPSAKEAEQLKNAENIDFNVIEKIFEKKAELKVSLGKNKLKDFFTEDTSCEEIEAVILGLLNKWKNNK